MYRIEIERADGTTFFRQVKGADAPTEWRDPSDADHEAWNLWAKFGDGERYVRFSVIEQDGSVYSDWEV